MKKIIYALILSVVVVSGLVFSFTPLTDSSGTNREIKTETTKKSRQKQLTAAERNTELKKWEASPDGVMFKNWEASPAGKKVDAGIAKISKSVRDYTNMEAIVTSLSLPPGSRLGFGVMVSINGDDYILTFRPEKSTKTNYNFESEFEQLYRLKVNDKIIIKSHSVSKAPKYSYPIVAGDYVERDGITMYKRAPRKDGC